jgi:hypothetical protein
MLSRMKSDGSWPLSLMSSISLRCAAVTKRIIFLARRTGRQSLRHAHAHRLKEVNVSRTFLLCFVKLSRT